MHIVSAARNLYGADLLKYGMKLIELDITIFLKLWTKHWCSIRHADSKEYHVKRRERFEMGECVAAKMFSKWPTIVAMERSSCFLFKVTFKRDF